MTIDRTWTRRIDLHLSDRPVQYNSRGTYRPQITEYVAFACDRGRDPAARDETLLTVFLDRRMALTGPPRPISSKTRQNISAAVRGWWRWCESQAWA